MAIVRINNETELLADIARGNQRAFNELFEAYYNVLGAYVLKMTKSIEVAEEVVQDTFVKIWLQRNTLTEIKNFNNYVFILCRNQTLDHLRKKAKESAFQSELELYLQESQNVEQLDNPAEEYRALIDQAVEKLPPQAKKVYQMSRYERLKHHEIADRLGISPETVKKHIQHAVDLIKKDLKSGVDPMIVLILLSPLLVW